MPNWGICSEILNRQQDQKSIFLSISYGSAICHQTVQPMFGFLRYDACDMMELLLKGIGKGISMDQMTAFYHFSAQSTQINSNCVLEKRFDSLTIESCRCYCCFSKKYSNKDTNSQDELIIQLTSIMMFDLVVY